MQWKENFKVHVLGCGGSQKGAKKKSRYWVIQILEVLTYSLSQSHITSSDMFSSLVYNALVLSVVGGIIFYFKSVCSWLLDAVKRKIFVSVILREEGSNHFRAVVKYVSNAKLEEKATRLELTNDRLYASGLGSDLRFREEKNRYIIESGGTHKFQFRGKTIYVSVFETHSDSPHSNWNRNSLRRIRFSTYGWSTKPLRDYIEYAIKMHEKECVDYLEIERPMQMNEMWRFGSKVTKRSTDTVILQRSMMSDIIKDVKWFRDQKKWYNSMGIPYRRGYLFCGPPGNGKTSTIRCVASECGLKLRVLTICNPLLTDDMLHGLISACGDGTMLVMEDIDALFKDKKVREKEIAEKPKHEPKTMEERIYGSSRKHIKNSGLTLSGLLNALDGVDSGEGYIVVMTTNYPENLDPALVRPGRVDRRFDFDWPDHAQIESMYTRFFPVEKEELSASRFATKVKDSAFPKSMAAIQGYLFRHRASQEDVFRDLDTFVNNHIATS